MLAFLKSITPNQWIALTIATLSALAGATAQLSDLFGAQVAHNIVTVSTLGTTLISSVLVSLTSQGAQVRNVNNMPGIERIVVNKDANVTLAQIASDPNNKVEAAPEAARAVAETAAKG